MNSPQLFIRRQVVLWLLKIIAANLRGHPVLSARDTIPGSFGKASRIPTVVAIRCGTHGDRLSAVGIRQAGARFLARLALGRSWY